MGIKKFRGFILGFIFIFILAGCGAGVDVSQLEPGIDDARISNVGVSAKVESLEKDGDSLYLNLIYQNNSERDVVYGKEPRLEIQVDGNWYEMKVKDDASWESIGIVIISDTTSEEQVDLNLYYDDLPSGHYRFLKRIDSFYRAAEFDL